MAKFSFSASFSSNPDTEYEIDDSEFEGKTEQERNEIIEEHCSQWVADVAASEIEQMWVEID